jgi:hypothetical protein
MIPTGSPAPPARRPEGWAWLVLLAAVALVAGPAVLGDWGRDDYFQLAFARLIGSPWPLFTHDHFPVPGSVFRPLGYASMWLDTALFGTGYRAHALVDLALHGAVAAALFGVLRRGRVARVPALAATLLFALHPAVVGAAVWWSARFDVLATLFVLLAVDGALAFRERRGAGALAGTLLALLAAMLCKEVGLAAVAPLSWLWLQAAAAQPRARRAPLLRATALAWLVVAGWFAWRAAVLGTAASALTGTLPLGSAVARGVLDWLAQMPGYVTFAARLRPWEAIVLLIALALVVAAGFAARARPARNATGAAGEARGLGASGLLLFALPALLQAPVAALNAAPLSAGVSAVQAAMQSRLYYLGIAGLALACGALLGRGWRRPAWRLPLGLAATLAVLAWAAASHRAATEFAARSRQAATLAHAASAAVAPLDLPPRECHVVLLGVQPAPEWDRFVSIDSIVKALSPDLPRVAHCWFHAEYPTWFHLVAAPADADGALPWHPLALDGVPVPWRRVGALVFAYLAPLPPADAAVAHVLRWNGEGFVEVARPTGGSAGTRWQ